MQESLILFSSIVKQEYFSRTTVILLLNKKDIFEEKIKVFPLNLCFTDYTGENKPQCTNKRNIMHLWQVII